MKLTKEECLEALENVKYWAMRELGINFIILEQLIEEHFDNSVQIEEGTMFKLFKNKPLEFEELEEGKWYWDNHCKEYFWIDYIDKELQSIGIYIDEEERIREVKYFEENRFYRREVKDEK